MKIAQMDLIPVAIEEYPLRNSRGMHQPYTFRLLVHLTADNGAEGWGETQLNIGGDRIFSPRPGTEALDALEARRRDIIGADPRHIERLRRIINEPQAFAGLETALLDLVGQATDTSVAELLGGRVRDRVDWCSYLFFKWDGEDEYGEVGDPEQMLGLAKLFHQRYGFRSHKLKGGVLHPKLEVETIRLLREHFGPHHALRIDPNAIWSVQASIRMARELQEYRLEYLEDPTWGRDGMAQVARHSEAVLATNMCVTAIDHVSDAYQKGSVKVLLLDHHVWGGLWATKQIGKVCEALGWGVSQHAGVHLGISQAAMTHLAAVTPQMTYASDTFYIWLKDDVIEEPFVFQEGQSQVPTGPGLGVKVNRDKVQELHELYLRHKDDDMDVTRLMQRYQPGWEFKRPRW